MQCQESINWPGDSGWLQTYIVRENANVKLCQYQIMISNGLFEETNEQRIFSKVFYD